MIDDDGDEQEQVLDEQLFEQEIEDILLDLVLEMLHFLLELDEVLLKLHI